MKKIFTILTCLFSIAVFAQHDNVLPVTLIGKIGGSIIDFTTDNLGNIYLLNATNQIKKVNEKGDSIAVYNDIRKYGKVYSIDATNPLKILVFYKDFSTIVVLDRLLNKQAAIDLRKQNILEVTAVTSSYDNNIWLYDEFDNKLKKVDDNGNVLLESTDFRQIFDSVPVPVAMYDRDGQLYIYDPKKGLMVFDYYGAKKNNLQLLHVSDLQVTDKNTIIARDNTHIILYKPATLQLLYFTAFTQQSRFSKINLNRNDMYCLNNKGELEIYSVDKSNF